VTSVRKLSVVSNVSQNWILTAHMLTLVLVLKLVRIRNMRTPSKVSVWVSYIQKYAEFTAV